MTNPAVRTTSPLAADDPTRELAIARSDDEARVHLAVVGDTYTVLLSGEQTDGRFAMLDMLIPPGPGQRRTVTTSRNASGCWRAR
jgi:hypothetical protein